MAEEWQQLQTMKMANQQSTKILNNQKWWVVLCRWSSFPPRYTSWGIVLAISHEMMRQNRLVLQQSKQSIQKWADNDYQQ